MGRGEDRWAGQGQLWGGGTVGEGVEEGEAGGRSVGFDPIEGNQKGATRPALTIPDLNIPEGCFGA